MGDDIKMDLKEVYDGVDWIQLAQGRVYLRLLVNTLMSLCVP
jgi:hypothetical protein